MNKLVWSGFICMLLSGCGWDGAPTRINDLTPLTSIEISAVSSTIAARTSTTLTAKGDLSGLSTRDITDQVVWSSDLPTVASFPFVTNPNRVKAGNASGTATLTATLGNVSATYTLTVSPATAAVLTMTPSALTKSKGLNTQFSVLGTFSDNSTQDLTFDANWKSDTTAVATVSDDHGSKGLAHAVTVGSATITATFDTVSASALLTVTAPVLQSITVTPANSSITGLSKTKSFTATGIYSDGSAADITNQVIWGSSLPGIATIIASSGVATSVSQGTTSISASLSGFSGKTDLKVTAPVLNANGLTISPVSLNMVVGSSSRFTVTAAFADGTHQDVTDSSEWASSAVSIANVSNTGADKGLVRGVAAGSATITATYGLQSLTAFVTVTLQ